MIQKEKVQLYDLRGKFVYHFLFNTEALFPFLPNILFRGHGLHIAIINHFIMFS